ncbi:MAG: ubiquitin-like small modifier protein 1 [Anaerolineales bacterium]
MNVNFYATLRQIVGQKTRDFDLNLPATLQALLDEILQKYPSMRGELLDENGSLYRHVHIFVNGRDVHFLEQGMQTVIDLADKIDVFPAVGGGVSNW